LSHPIQQGRIAIDDEVWRRRSGTDCLACGLQSSDSQPDRDICRIRVAVGIYTLGKLEPKFDADAIQAQPQSVTRRLCLYSYSYLGRTRCQRNRS